VGTVYIFSALHNGPRVAGRPRRVLNSDFFFSWVFCLSYGPRLIDGEQVGRLLVDCFGLAADPHAGTSASGLGSAPRVSGLDLVNTDYLSVSLSVSVSSMQEHDVTWSSLMTMDREDLAKVRDSPPHREDLPSPCQPPAQGCISMEILISRYLNFLASAINKA